MSSRRVPRRALKVQLPHVSVNNRKRASDEEAAESAKQRALDQEPDVGAKQVAPVQDGKKSVSQHVDDALGLLHAGRLDEALALVSEHKLAENSTFCQLALDRLPKALQTAETLSKFTDAGVPIAKLWTVMEICGILLNDTEPGVFPSDGYMLELLKHSPGCYIPYVCDANMLGTALTGNPAHTPSPCVMAAIRERCANTAEWFSCFSLALAFERPCVGERLGGATIMVDGTDLTKTIPERILSISGYRLVSDVVLDNLVSYSVASGLGLEWTRAIACYEYVVGTKTWWRKFLRQYGTGLVTQEWVDCASKSDKWILPALKKAAAATENQ